MPDETILRHRMLESNGIRLHVAEAGPADGPLVLLLHGFPEFWYGWRHQLTPLAKAGYLVVAPDQRGYNLSDRPSRVAAYAPEVLAADVAGLISAYGREQANVVGHDWGGAIAWWLAAMQPQRVRTLAILNVPHPLVMHRHLRHNAKQRRRSWYIFFFQLPWLPEWRMRRDNWAIGRAALQRTSRPGTFSDAELQAYCVAWSQPGAARGMINWYRAALRHGRLQQARIASPVLLIWGARDRFLGQEMVEPSLALCDDARLELLPEASHWVQHEEPGRVNALLLDFFRR